MQRANRRLASQIPAAVEVLVQLRDVVPVVFERSAEQVERPDLPLESTIRFSRVKSQCAQVGCDKPMRLEPR